MRDSIPRDGHSRPLSETARPRVASPVPARGSSGLVGSVVGVQTATLHAVLWLALGNAVGLLLATLLLAPGIGRHLGALTYGRWVPVHYDALLYGWCGLALTALLLRLYTRRQGRGWGVAAVGVWSGSLLYASISWLAGHTSGRPFLEWRGPARLLLALDLAFLSIVLLHGLARETAAYARRDVDRTPLPSLVAKWALLTCLLPVPALMFWAAGPSVQPPINPSSGGPTGVSLMGSTLGIVVIVLLIPFAVGLGRRGPWREYAVPVALLATHLGWFAWLDHGDHSNREPIQILALASLAIWFPVLARYLRQFDWPATSRRWLYALACWGGALPATAIPTFLPGVLERWKFTNALVGHAHLAMAGFVTTLLVVLLIGLNREGPLRGLFASKAAFWSWNAGTAVHVLSMLGLGTLEGADPGVVIRGEPVVVVFFAARWVAGAVMFVASAMWARAALRAVSTRRTGVRHVVGEWHHAA